MDFSKYINDYYVYKAKCIKCFDGDTCTLEIDLGFKTTMVKTVRLFGINTPELYKGDEESKKKGEDARDFVREQILDKEVVLYTVKDKTGKYGRLLGIIFVKQGDTLVNINKLLLDTERAVVYE